MPLDAATVLEERGAVFINRGCLFVSTTGKLLTGYVNCEIIFPHFDIMWDLSDEHQTIPRRGRGLHLSFDR